MRGLIALALASLIACSDSSGPNSTPLVGTYVLTSVDGNALPYTVTVDEEATPIASGMLELSEPNNLALTVGLGTPGSPAFQVLSLSGFYRRVTADSVVFPALLTPEFFLRRTGSTVVLVIQPSGSGLGFAEAVGGAHRFTFVEEP